MVHRIRAAVTRLSTARFRRRPELHQRTRTLLLQLARFALAAAPDLLVQRLHLIEQLRVIGDDAELEVGAAAALRAEDCAAPVRAAEIGQLAIADHRLEMHARTAPQLEPHGAVRAITGE